MNKREMNNDSNSIKSAIPTPSQPEQRSEFNRTTTPAPEQKSDSRMKGKPNPAQNVGSTKDSDPTL